MYKGTDAGAQTHKTNRKSICLIGLASGKCPVNSGKHLSNIQFSVIDPSGTKRDIIVEYA